MLPALLVSFIATVPVLLQFFDDESLRYTVLSGDLPVELEPISRITTAISLLFMIRLVKVIGTDRDSIIARNIQVVATEFPVSHIVFYLIRCRLILVPIVCKEHILLLISLLLLWLSTRIKILWL